MSKVLIVLFLFLLLAGGVVFYQLSQASVKTNGKVTIGKNVFDVETAKSDKDKQIGLTKYKSLKESQGMLFVFDQKDNYSFWMKNMKFSIDIIFIDNDTIVDLVENATPPVKDTEPIVYKSDSPVNYVLEIKSGLVKKHNIKTGDKLKIEIK
jgi:hypothetical protein